MLNLIKKRLLALTHLNYNLLDIENISYKYKLEKNLLMMDYFGFKFPHEDQENVEWISDQEIFDKIDFLQSEIENNVFKAIPISLICLKHKIPMFIVFHLIDYFNLNQKIQVDMANRSKENKLKDFVLNLIKIREKLFLQKDNLEQINKILK